MFSRQCDLELAAATEINRNARSEGGDATTIEIRGATSEVRGPKSAVGSYLHLYLVDVSDTEYYDPYTSNSETDSNYWSNSYSLKSSTHRILYNPFSNNGTVRLSGF